MVFWAETVNKIQNVPEYYWKVPSLDKAEPIIFELTSILYWNWSGSENILDYSRLFHNITERHLLSTKLNTKYESIYIYIYIYNIQCLNGE